MYLYNNTLDVCVKHTYTHVSRCESMLNSYYNILYLLSFVCRNKGNNKIPKEKIGTNKKKKKKFNILIMI